MIFEHSSNKKNILLLVSAVILIVGVFLSLYSPIIFQEGNPWPQIRGIAQLTFGKSDIVQLSGSKNTFMTESKNGTIIHDFLKTKGYEFTGQMGSGYFFESEYGIKLTVIHRYYSRFYSLWKLSISENLNEQIKWTEYKNQKYNFQLSYPSISISNYFLGLDSSDVLSFLDFLSPYQISSIDNHFYLHQKYNISINQKTGEITKTESQFVLDDILSSYPKPWHIKIFTVETEYDLDKVIKQTLGVGCNYTNKIQTNFLNNYRIEFEGDGKDLGSTLCPVNYANYIIYSPTQKRVAFWSMGQECNIGLGFTNNNCFDLEIAESFHFL